MAVRNDVVGFGATFPSSLVMELADMTGIRCQWRSRLPDLQVVATWCLGPGVYFQLDERHRIPIRTTQEVME